MRRPIHWGLLISAFMLTFWAPCSPSNLEKRQTSARGEFNIFLVKNGVCLAQNETERSSFQEFLQGFRAVDPPVVIPLKETVPNRFLLTGVLEKIPVHLIDRYLLPHLPNFDTEAEDEIFENFNFPEFKSYDYYYYLLPTLKLNIVCVIIYLHNSFSSYFGLATYGKAGEFVDQLFVAGREGGSGAMYTLESAIHPDGIVELLFEHRSWGKELQRKKEKSRRYRIQASGRIIRLN